MTLFSETAPVLVTCPKGMSGFLATELTGMGLPDGETLDAGVLTRGTLEDCMRLNLHLRTGHRVLYELKRFDASGPDALYATARTIDWEKYIPADGYFRVDASIRDTGVTDSRFAAVRVKDAVADRFMERLGRRPDSGPLTSGVCLFLHWRGRRATLYLDTTGDPLPRRGYRKRPHTAPMQETLAAACILASDWPAMAAAGGHFVAPMCGSGTLAIEAALIAMRGAPGLLRDDFAFMRLPGFNPAAWERLTEEAEDAETPDFGGRIIATDHDPAAIEAARDNARNAGVGDFIEFAVCDFRETEVPDGPGVVMLNPEYGERLGEARALEPVYRAIGDFFKQRCRGKKGFLFTGNLDLAKHVGLRTRRRHILYNAKIECRLLEYELYEGTRKQA
ncbi:class I SAM-dependent RNA methyltransferase [Pseudodesulfovibrio sp. F-1]|uniref:Class I SAM-dependent RNA methyltransferase n=1 Tax=Pseudodesulfovibrio alkaliphilus TaxID=2661613 RepID=A0A7K1KM99_9BACT|nr:class I SAM-dependent RNA methyltransferase [Pseudodesulfovibrio alkaliphilus]MUM77137.1 class I SAM-dependent RNA methyltransferase [Pseudodesulfovibrio alkaliphilus]